MAAARRKKAPARSATKGTKTTGAAGTKKASKAAGREASTKTKVSARPADDDRLRIRIRARLDESSGVELRATQPAMEEEVDYWLLAIENRRRFVGGQASRERQANLARGTLEIVFGADAAQLDRLVLGYRGSAVLEVELAHDAPDTFFAMPWEYLLTAAVDPDVEGLVVRRLRGLPRSVPPKLEKTLAPAMYLECQAGKLTDCFHWFNEERQLYRWLQLAKWTQLPVREGSDEPVKTSSPTIDQIRKQVRAVKPKLLHVSGYDAKAGHAYLRQLGITPSKAPERGVVVADSKAPGGIGFVDAKVTADMLCGHDSPPDFVAFSLHRSAELALEAVRAGAASALGRDGEWDDEADATEQLHREIYRVLGLNATRSPGEWGFTLLQAVLAGIGAVRKLAAVLTGTGIVLYTRASIIDGAEDTGTPIPAPPAAAVQPQVELFAKPYPDINYAMLHNGRSLFRRLQLRRMGPGAATVDVSVRLSIGNQPFEYDDKVHVDSRLVDLTNRVIVPLGWIEDKMPSECVRTSLVVASDQTVPRTHVFPISLLPIDSWRDDDLNRQWLPSFVAPRDPAVMAVLRRARPHLAAITDDPAAGFSGYQEPKRIDAQARAIWTAILSDDLQYVNPPPSYTLTDQRVRSPSRIFAEHKGTCLDLALLLAACFEAVEIHPVLFLLQGHAFCGYWRSQGAFDDFWEESVLGPRGLRSRRQRAKEKEEGENMEAAWLFGTQWYPRIRALTCDERAIVPLEATYLTGRNAFTDAAAAGLDNLRSQKDFHSMLDVGIARDHRVTPLPLLEVL